MKSETILILFLFSYSILWSQNNNKFIEKPNILFITIDDMNDWTTIFDKNNPIQIPNIEKLAERGVFFSKDYVQAYQACASFADEMIGKIINALDNKMNKTTLRFLLLNSLIRLPKNLSTVKNNNDISFGYIL